MAANWERTKKCFNEIQKEQVNAAKGKKYKRISVLWSLHPFDGLLSYMVEMYK